MGNIPQLYLHAYVLLFLALIRDDSKIQRVQGSTTKPTIYMFTAAGRELAAIRVSVYNSSFFLSFRFKTCNDRTNLNRSGFVINNFLCFVVVEQWTRAAIRMVVHGRPTLRSR